MVLQVITPMFQGTKSSYTDVSKEQKKGNATQFILDTNVTLISKEDQKNKKKKLQAHLIDENELKILNKDSSKAVPVGYAEKHELWN